MIAIAIINGSLRDLWYVKYFGDTIARQISTITLILFFGIYIGVMLNKFPLQSASQAWMVGIIWLLLTLAFEFGFGRLAGHTWSQMFQEYNLFKGRIWLFIPVWITIAPYLFYKLFER